MCSDFSVPSASQAQNHSHDCDQQEHEDQATDDWQEGNTQKPCHGILPFLVKFFKSQELIAQHLFD